MKLRLLLITFVLFLLILPAFITQVESYTSNTLYAHAETTTLPGGNVYYTLKSSSANGPTTTLSQSAASTGRKLMGKWIYPLNGIVSVSASSWTVTYRAKKGSSATYVLAHCDIDILIRKSDNTIRATIATNVANSPTITGSNVWRTLTGTYNWPSYTVVDQTDYLEVAYYIEVTQKQSFKSVYLLVDDGTLPLADQTKIENVVFAYPNQDPVAFFTYSPPYPLIYDPITFNASASYDPDGSIVSYQWDFGDGNITTVTDPIIAHIYTIAGSQVNYAVTLTVTDDGGSIDSATQNVLVTNPSILYVSLPAGTYNGPDQDKWVSQCWLLDNTGSSGTFTVRINNTGCGVPSYNTHLVVAINDAAHAYFDSLTVGTTAIPKTSFTNSTPQPYGYTLTWEGDVYPTWFSDVYVVGDMSPDSCRDVEVFASFLNASGVRMHFDAYGSATYPPPPTKTVHITHNPHQKDSTVLFCPPPITRYYLTVGTDPFNITTISGEGWYDEGTNVVLTAPGEVPVSTGVRYRFSYWDVDGTPEIGNPIAVAMDANHTATAHYVLQYYLAVSSHYGMTGGEGWYDKDSTAYATVTPLTVPEAEGVRYVFINWSGDATGSTSPSDPIVMNGLKTAIASWQPQYYLAVSSPYGTTGGEGWYNSASLAYAALNTDTIDYGNGTRRVFTHWSGDASGSNYLQSDPIFMSKPKTAIANWKLQYYLAVSSPSNSPPYGSPSPTSGWFDNGTEITASVTSPWPGSEGTRYMCTGWTGTGSVPSSGTGTSVTFTLMEPSSITWNWKTQCSLTVFSLYDSPTPTSDWFDDGTNITAYVTSPCLGPEGTRYVCIGWTGTGSVPSSGTGTSVTFTLMEPSSITWNWKTQYQVIFDQTGAGSDFTGTVVTIDSVNYTINDLPTTTDFWWDENSDHSFLFASPLTVNPDKQYAWQSTSGLSCIQGETLMITTSGEVIGNYIEQNRITFDQTGVGPDFAGTIIIIDGVYYNTLPQSFAWEINTVHTFAFQSPLSVNGKRYVWTSTTGLSDQQGGSINVTTYGSIVGSYKTQYYLTLATNPSRVDAPAGAGWYDAGTYASISTDALVDMVPGSSRYRFNGWITTDMSEITNPSGSSTTVLLDKAKTVTANYVIQYYFEVSSPSNSPPYGAPLPSPPGDWFDVGTLITASVTSPWSGPPGTRYVCIGWTGTGSVPSSGSGTSVTFTFAEPSSITWNWKTQYYLTVQTSAPTTIPGEDWYDNGTIVSLEAPYVAGYEFIEWRVDGTPKSGNPIEVYVDAPHTAAAHYEGLTSPTVGGYSVSLAEPTGTAPIVGYTIVLAIFGVAMTLIRRKRK